MKPSLFLNDFHFILSVLEWAAGAIAYEIFGQKHPFQNQAVDKESYNIGDLPELKGYVLYVVLYDVAFILRERC